MLAVAQERRGEGRGWWPEWNYHCRRRLTGEARRSAGGAVSSKPPIKMFSKTTVGRGRTRTIRKNTLNVQLPLGKARSITLAVYRWQGSGGCADLTRRAHPSSSDVASRG